jgi:hypothetical protein
MKLVELLAKELAEWPKSIECITQDLGGTIWGWKYIGASYGDMGWYSPPDEDCEISDIDFEASCEASDHKKAIVTREMWQAERDRQKGGEWKRHRAGRNQPVVAEARVEVKLRCGDIQQGRAHEFIWLHSECDVAANIMQYRIISQPQADEVEVHTPNAKTVEVMDASDRGEGLTRFENTEHVFTTLGIVDQIDGPIKWRDTIIHCQAIIEDCEREIQRNVDLLDAEGLYMQLNAKVGMAYGESHVDIWDWRNWRVGDKIRMTANDWCDLSKGAIYEIVDSGDDYITIIDDVEYRRMLEVDGETMFEDGRLIDFEFVSSP